MKKDTIKKPSKQELEALNKVVDFNKESNDSKKDVIYTPAKDENLENEKSKVDGSQTREQIKRDILAWKENQADYFVFNDPPDTTGLCNKSAWSFHERSISVLSAQGGTGKSYFLLALAMCFSAGVSYSEFEPKRPYKVLCLFGEDPIEIVHFRYRNIFKEFGLEEHRSLINENLNVKSINDMRLAKYDQKNRIENLENTNLIREVLEAERAKGKSYDIIILDPLTRFYGLCENDNDDCVFFYDVVLGSIMKEYNVSFILAHHLSKAGLNETNSSNITPRGAGGFRENARYTLAMRGLTNKEIQRFGIKEEQAIFYTALQPNKANYTKKSERIAYFRCNPNGVLVPTDFDTDYLAKVKEEVFSIICEYYDQDYIEYNGIREPIPTPRENLAKNVLLRNNNPKFEKLVNLIQKRINEKTNFTGFQNNLDPILDDLVCDGKISIVTVNKTGKKEIIPSNFSNRSLGF